MNLFKANRSVCVVHHGNTVLLMMPDEHLENRDVAYSSVVLPTLVPSPRLLDQHSRLPHLQEGRSDGGEGDNKIKKGNKILLKGLR